MKRKERRYDEKQDRHHQPRIWQRRTHHRQKGGEKLGIPCYDSELIQKIAEESGFAENYVKEAGEYVPGGFLSSVLANRAFGPTNEDILWETQCRVIMELAEKGPCVIVGRCADYLL